jgi:hypothetical protein
VWARLQATGAAGSPCARIAATAAAVGTDIFVFGGRWAPGAGWHLAACPRSARPAALPAARLGLP